MNVPPRHPGHQPAPAADLVPAQPKRVQAPVNPALVTEANAHAKAEALDEEIAHDEETNEHPAVATHPSAGKP
jgi:hypothetical protein